ncbi:MAG: hypothetical protein ACRDL7_12880 [Gaiellaceae bacterium]
MEPTELEKLDIEIIEADTYYRAALDDLQNAKDVVARRRDRLDTLKDRRLTLLRQSVANAQSKGA